MRASVFPDGSPLRRKLTRALGLGPRDWGALLVAAAALLRARFRFARVPVRHLVEELTAGSSSVAQAALDPAEAARVRRLAWAIAVAAAHVPWRSDCLIQAIAAAKLLERTGLPSHFYLGVSKGPDGELLAHAWLRSGETIVNGGSVEGFSILIGPASRFGKLLPDK